MASGLVANPNIDIAVKNSKDYSVDASKLNQSIVNLSATAAKTMLSYLNSVTIAGVRIRCESIVCSKDSDISEQVIIDDTGYRRRVQDSVNPKLRVWTIKGYIINEEYEFTQYYLQSIERNKGLIDRAIDSRLPLIFRDKNGKKYDVLIESFKSGYVGNIQNGLPIDLTLKEWISYASVATNVDFIEEMDSGDNKQGIGKVQSKTIVSEEYKVIANADAVLNDQTIDWDKETIVDNKTNISRKITYDDTMVITNINPRR
jgi:hypothetical protein